MVTCFSVSTLECVPLGVLKVLNALLGSVNERAVSLTSVLPVFWTEPLDAKPKCRRKETLRKQLSPGRRGTRRG